MRAAASSERGAAGGTAGGSAMPTAPAPYRPSCAARRTCSGSTSTSHWVAMRRNFSPPAAAEAACAPGAGRGASQRCAAAHGDRAAMTAAAIQVAGLGSVWSGCGFIGKVRLLVWLSVAHARRQVQYQ
jgi:hypothetical protein